jgi:hypothetical protein
LAVFNGSVDEFQQLEEVDKPDHFPKSEDLVCPEPVVFFAKLRPHF